MFGLNGGNFSFTPTANLVHLYAKRECINIITKKRSTQKAEMFPHTGEFSILISLVFLKNSYFH